MSIVRAIIERETDEGTMIIVQVGNKPYEGGMGIYFLSQAEGQLLVTGDETENIQWTRIEHIAQWAKDEPEKFD